MRAHTSLRIYYVPRLIRIQWTRLTGYASSAPSLFKRKAKIVAGTFNRSTTTDIETFLGAFAKLRIGTNIF
jgi:hypothetical protein